MTRLIVSLLGCIAIAAAADIDSELSQAARSPEEIQRFVETHSAFDWAPLWKALKISGPKPRGCEEEWASQSCSSELIGVMSPPQTLVHLRHGSSPPNLETWLRYFRQSAPGGSVQWRFAGSFESLARYFPLRHRVVMFEGAPFLAATEQGASGTGVSSEVEKWRDLRRPDFNPVFSYATEGDFTALADGQISRHFRGDATTLNKYPVESITVFYRMDVTYDRAGEALQLGSRQDTAVFTRRNGDAFEIDDKLSTASSADLAVLYGANGDAFSCDDLLLYDLASLSEIAANPDTKDDRRVWLGKFINRWCADSPEKSKLNSLLQSDDRK